MYHYKYTSDMRVSNLEEKAIEFAKMFLNDAVPSAQEDKSLNNSANSIGYYLNLISKGNCAKVAANGDFRTIVLNFIKTFQFPNPRTLSSMNDAQSDGILLAPLREIIKILFLAYQRGETDFYLTREEIFDFIFYNSSVAKQRNVNREDLIDQILEFRSTGSKPSTIELDLNNRDWDQSDRQLRELLSILVWSGFVENESDKYRIKIPDGIDPKNKADFFDILMFDDFWEPVDNQSLQNNRDSYFEYCDNQVSLESLTFEDHSSIECKGVEWNIQEIYFGAPGTGKSFGVDRVIEECYPSLDIKENPFVFKTTIYSDYSYYNFIGNIMPMSKNGEIGYDFKAGIFSQALATAFEYEDKEIFLIIEEMSRGNIASIFGDIFQLLDRDRSGISEYSINNDLVMHYFRSRGINKGNKIYLPRNFHIIGTVNTSDQNVNVLDTAFKRRFEFKYADVTPVKKENGEFENTYIFTLDGEDYEWNRFYMSLNEFIVTNLELNEDKQLGQFFIKFNNYTGNDEDERRYAAIQNKLLHYLWEDVQGACISDEYSIFKKEYKTFSSAYKKFGERKNIFSKELLEIYQSIKL